jgi:hypothetical protein
MHNGAAWQLISLVSVDIGRNDDSADPWTEQVAQQKVVELGKTPGAQTARADASR